MLDGTTRPVIPYKFTIVNEPQLEAPLRPQEVEIAILDTAPSCRQLVTAYNKWHNVHPLLCELLGPHGIYGYKSPLTVTYAEEFDIRLPTREELRVKGHDYTMSDHGLFAAGIAHSIAPKACLRLIEVLNEYGVGSIHGIATAIRRLADERVERAKHEQLPQLIVNLSLTVVMPLPGQEKRDSTLLDDLTGWNLFEAVLDKRRRDELAQEQREELQQALGDLCLALEWICVSVRGEGVLVVAAAGNDATNDEDAHGNKQRPQARFPAAFKTVIGVGALKKDDKSADYSNRSDEPNVDGLATFGGARDVPSNTAKEGDGVLGVYIGQFPQKSANPNENGWGWWAGTSFAAPAIAGALARLISTGAMPDEAVLAIRTAQNGNTDDGDEIFSIVQG
jgi:hypothetical protein